MQTSLTYKFYIFLAVAALIAKMSHFHILRKTVHRKLDTGADDQSFNCAPVGFYSFICTLYHSTHHRCCHTAL